MPVAQRSCCLRPSCCNRRAAAGRSHSVPTNPNELARRRVVSQNCNSTNKQIVIIGAGIGGICTAGRLARAGHRVTVLEKNPELGGRAQTVTHDGFRFDSGPSLLLFPDTYRQAFEALGSRIEDHVQLVQVAPSAYRVHFEGGGHLDLLNDGEAMARQLEAEEVGAGEQYFAFLKAARATLRMGVRNFIEQDFASLRDAAQLPGTLLRVLPSLRDIPLPQILGPHKNMMKRYFQDWRLRALFTFQDLYVGLSPWSAPGVYSLLAGTELTDGVWYPKGGFGKVDKFNVVEGLVKASQECGALFRLNAEVASINSADGAVSGVTLTSGEVLPADVVVSNRDVPASYPLLHSEYGDRRAQQLSGKEFSAGVISYNWSVGRCVGGLIQHNVFLSGGGREAWQRARSASELLQRPNFYVHCPARADPDAAPLGADSVMVLLPVANMQESGTDNYEALVDAGRTAILDTLKESGIGDLAPHIFHEEVITPPAWRQRYGLEHGAAFGLSHGLNQLAVFRPSIRDNAVRGLYHVGASTRPGNGVPLCMTSAALSAEQILQDFPPQDS